MKKILISTFCLFTLNAFAWEKTCDSKSLDQNCRETSANFGTPMQCAIGLPAAGRHCTKTDDLGMCRYTAVAGGNYKTVTDTFYYEGHSSCYDLTNDECTEHLKEICVMVGEQQWFAPGATH